MRSTKLEGLAALVGAGGAWRVGLHETSKALKLAAISF
jgi:hypothetical protein